MNIMMRSCLFELFLKSHDADKEEWWKVLGYIFFRIGIGIGVLFLFEDFFPLIGHLAGGAGISALLLFGGVMLLFLNRKMKSTPQETPSRDSPEILNDMDIEE